MLAVQMNNPNLPEKLKVYLEKRNTENWIPSRNNVGSLYKIQLSGH